MSLRVLFLCATENVGCVQREADQNLQLVTQLERQLAGLRVGLSRAHRQPDCGHIDSLIVDS